jgi:diaminopimelate decarboxylase
MCYTEPIEFFKEIKTPFYYYDMDLLRETLKEYTSYLTKYNYSAHYAMKANAQRRIMEEVRKYGLGIDCVSGNEVKMAIKYGFSPDKIVFAGVGKTDAEIKTALKAGIFAFNCESIPEIKIIGEFAKSMGRKARISIRINPDIDAHTHKYISTGLKENKFGISPWMFEDVLNVIEESDYLELMGLHFHIGSQITELDVFKVLCERCEILQKWFLDRGKLVENIDLGGGLGVNYENPHTYPIADFEHYFSIINKNLKVRPGQRVHFEPGRAIVAQCGSLISRVLYVKEGSGIKFVILDAGMNDLIRPALYHAHHKIENIVSSGRKIKYEVVGPVCESSDVWDKKVVMPITSRGDLVAIRSTGAYGQVMSMRYNQRDLAKDYYSDDIKNTKNV